MTTSRATARPPATARPITCLVMRVGMLTLRPGCASTLAGVDGLVVERVGNGGPFAVLVQLDTHLRSAKGLEEGLGTATHGAGHEHHRPLEGLDGGRQICRVDAVRADLVVELDGREQVGEDGSGETGVLDSSRRVLVNLCEVGRQAGGVVGDEVAVSVTAEVPAIGDHVLRAEIVQMLCYRRPEAKARGHDSGLDAEGLE